MKTIDRDIYIVRCFQGDYFYPERLEQDTHREETIADILSGQVEHVDRVFLLNPARGTSRDVSREVARAVADKAAHEGRSLSYGVRTFIHEQLGVGVSLQAAE